MGDYQLLQNVNRNYISQDDEDLKKANALLKQTLEIFIKEARRQSEVFNKLYQEIYYSGSAFDGLQVASCTSNDFDLNIKFRFPTNKVAISGLEHSVKKMNFAELKVTDFDSLKDEHKAIVDPITNTVSPKRMYSLLKTAGDRALTELRNQLRLPNGKVYSITRSEGAPYMLNIRGSDLSISIDLVPSIHFSQSHLPTNGRIASRVKEIQRIVGDGSDVGFMAICLWKADSERFEIDFHDLERKVLHHKGCVKTVIRLLKLLRNKKGGSMNKSWSHLIKTIVMHEVLKNHSTEFWNERHLVSRFVGTLRIWHANFKDMQVMDLFFIQMNLMDRISKYHQAISDVRGFLGNLLARYDRESNLTFLFSQKEYPLVPDISKLTICSK